MRYSDLVPKRIMGVAQFHLHSNNGESPGWQTVNIETELDNDLGIVLSSYQLSVPAGKYLVTYGQNPVRLNWNLLALYDVTNTTLLTPSQTCSSYHYSTGGTFADLQFQPGYVLELTETTVIEFRIYVGVTMTQAGHAPPPDNYPANISFMRFAE